MIPQLRIFATVQQEEPPQLRIGPYHKYPSEALQLRKFATWQARSCAMSPPHNFANLDSSELCTWKNSCDRTLGGLTQLEFVDSRATSQLRSLANTQLRNVAPP